MRASLVALLAAAPAALGCAGTVSGSADGVDAEAVATTSAVVSVERTSEGGESSRAAASARFLRVFAPASPEDALRTIGAAFDLPAPGTCAALAAVGNAPAGQRAPVVELADVGAVSIEADGTQVLLLPRRLPDVTDVVSGVVYARAVDPATVPTDARYVLRIAGAPGEEPVEVAASAPRDPAEIALGGEREDGTLVASGPTVDLSWKPGAPGDLVYVDVQPNGVRCAFGDAGHGSLSTLLLDDAGTLVVHRLRRQAWSARGIDAGEIRFDFARSVSYVRR